MTYFELLSKANRLLEKGEITIGQRDEMTKPLWDEIRPKGKWIDNKEEPYYPNCSCCGYQIDIHENRGYFSFCPYCGADMRGGDKE